MGVWSKGMITIFKKFFGGLKKLFTRQGAVNVFNKALEISPQVLFIIDFVATIGTTLSPPTWDDALWNGVIKTKYPELWDGRFADMSVAARKLFLLGIATEIIKSYFPGVSTTTARLAAQAAYAAKYGEEQNIPSANSLAGTNSPTISL
jgi:hypothetical protein